MSTPNAAGQAKVAFVISAYRLPAMLVRLVERLDGPGTATYIHVDAKTPEDTFRAMAEPLAGRSNVHFLPRHACHWGDFGHVRATLKGLRALIETGQPFDYVVLLTGQDYPLRPRTEIAATLGNAGGSVFMRPMPIPNQYWTNGGTCRYENRHFRAAGRSFAFPGVPFRSARLNAIWSRVARIGGLYRSFPDGLQPWGGSSYWILPADCVRYIDDFVRRSPGFVRFFRSVRIPDEIFFHTIVMNSPFRNRLGTDDRRYVNWAEGGDNPRILTSRDLPALLSSGALFARKFDPAVDADVLDRIDEQTTREP